jgi:hypothetical protein
MTERSREEVVVTDSGGTMTRLTEPPRAVTPDLSWLKDADELAAGAASGWYSPEQADAIRDVAELARRELVEPRAWPMDEGWETWRPPTRVGRTPGAAPGSCRKHVGPYDVGARAAPTRRTS